MFRKFERRTFNNVAFTTRLETFDVLGMLFAIVMPQRRLGIKHVHLTRATILKQHDDRLGAPREMSRPRT